MADRLAALQDLESPAAASDIAAIERMIRRAEAKLDRAPAPGQLRAA